MEHLNRFLDFFKKKVSKKIDTEEDLYIQLDADEIDTFHGSHNAIKIDQSIFNDIKNFIIQNNSIKYLSKVDILENGLITIQHENSDGIHPKDAWISINLFDDEWFIVNVISGKKATVWHFKCDTIEGVKQILLRYPEFNSKNSPQVLIVC